MNEYAATVHKIIDVMRLHRANCEKRIGELGIHHSQHRLLMYLAKNERGVPSQKELAKHFNVSPAAITGSLKKLESGGYIRKKSVQSDLRTNSIEITDKGRQVISVSKEIFDTVDREMFKDFEESDLVLLNNYIEKIKENMSTDEKMV